MYRHTHTHIHTRAEPKRDDDALVAAQVTMQFAAGEVVAVVGRTGAGKLRSKS